MASELVIAVAQINPTVGDIDGNLELIRHTRAKAADAKADLVLFSELVICGYPPEDLVLKPALQDHCHRAIQNLARDTSDGGPALLVGTPWVENDKLYNAVALLKDGEVKATRYKYDLPNYGVFDEKRVFEAGPIPGPMPFHLQDGTLVRLGAMVCEDMWTEDVAEGLEESGAEILIIPNGSPFEHDKQDLRLNLAVARVTETALPLIYGNQVGGQDELVFDGGSFVLNADCRMVAQSPYFETDLLITRWQRDDDERWRCKPAKMVTPPAHLQSIYLAMCMGLRDYVEKNRFPGVVLGLSGGIDSALTAAVAADALGPERVHAVMMPSRYTSKESLEDAAGCAKALGIRLDEVAIEPAVQAFDSMMSPIFDGLDPDITEENIQARIRGVLLMAISNKLGSMLLTTGNKSEMSVGYATLYGDMCGGYSVLKDVYKTTVFALSEWRNEHHDAVMKAPEGMVIPERIITKPPSAELRPDQKDEDSLPPYDELDAILQALVEDDRSAGGLIKDGYERETVQRVSNLLDLAEYKRRQAPPGVKITRKAFGRDRRYPITNAFRRIDGR